MKLVSYNIRFGLGLEGQIDLKRIADTVRDADVVALQEVERHWQRSGMADQPALIAAHLPDRYWVYGPAFDVNASETTAEGHVINRRRQFGTMLISRWPIVSSRVVPLPKWRTVTNFNNESGALEGVIETPGGALRIYSLHLSSLGGEERVEQIRRLLDHHRTVPMQGGAWTGTSLYDPGTQQEVGPSQNWSNGEAIPPMPEDAILMGDFNSEPESPPYLEIVGARDAASGRTAYQRGFIDAWDAAECREGAGETWWPDPPERAPQHPMRLDYCFLPGSWDKRVKRAWIEEGNTASDHRPLWVEVSDS